ncbi:3-dehydroquinate dehydratase [Luteibacter sp. 621]
MSILVITGPRNDMPAAPLADAAMCRLWERAQSAGIDLSWRPCRDFSELGHCLRCGNNAELILLDVDADSVPACHVAGLRDALSALPVPYIEVHDDSRESDASVLAPGHPALVSVVVPGNAAAGYDMALSIGLRYLAEGARLAA